VDLHALVRARRSVRAWQPREVPEDLLLRILESARFAPSAKNKQEWRFIAVRDAGTRARLAQAAAGQTFVGEAPVVLVCCAETDNHSMRCGQLSYPLDLAIVIDHITLLAAAEGLGTCWIGAFYEEQVKVILGIPPAVRVVELLPIGWPRDPEAAPKSRLPLSALLRRERWE